MGPDSPGRITFMLRTRSSDFRVVDERLLASLAPMLGLFIKLLHFFALAQGFYGEWLNLPVPAPAD